MASNIPLGTYVTDGVRTGPLYTGQLPQGFVADINGVITSSSHDNYGPGVLLSSQSTWNITPAAPAGGATRLNNLVGPTPAASVPVARDLILRGDNSVTYLNGGVVKFDWPRIVTVTITGANITNGTNVTIFGTDWYGFPLQHTYTLAAAPATYPTINLPARTITNPSTSKAFYTVNRVFIDAALLVGSTISLGCADAFGLPYRAFNAGDITSIGWDDLSDLFVPAAPGIVAPLGIFVASDPATSTKSTGDVRGFYIPSDAADGVKNLRFTYYVKGADTWINQVANRQQLYKQQTGSATPQGVPVAPLNLNDLVGVPQFYTGSPN